MMEVLANTMVATILQYISVSNQHVGHLKLHNVSYTSIKPGKTKTKFSDPENCFSLSTFAGRPHWLDGGSCMDALATTIFSQVNVKLHPL